MVPGLVPILFAQFTPRRLFAGGAKGAWYDPSDLSTMFQNSNGTTAVTADGDPVGYIADKSGNRNHWTQATAGLRPLYKTSGGLRWLDFDGTDDAIAVTASFGSGVTAFIAFRQTADTQWLLCYHTGGDATRFLGVGQAAGTNSYGSGVGTPALRVNAAAIGATRQNLLDAVPSATDRMFTAENLDMSTWTDFFFGGYTTFELTGRLYGLILAADQSAGVRNKTERWLAAKAGVTL